MSHLLFVDESGHDHRESPYEVLAGVAIEDRDLWNLVTAIAAAEKLIFGRRYREGAREIKGKKLLDRGTFRQATVLPEFNPDERTQLAAEMLEFGDQPSRRRLTALAQAKLAFVQNILNLCGQFRCKIFASIVLKNAARPQGDKLRKDYAYLFERFYYFLEQVGPEQQGLIMFDEIEKSQSHVLVNQMARYFLETVNGRQRSGQIIPEPFFVHSDLTTGVQIADIVAYIISWNLRLRGMTEPRRTELDDLCRTLLGLRFRTEREIDGNPNFGVWSVTYIDDLRPQNERLAEQILELRQRWE